MMTDSAGTPQKQHRRRHTASHDHRVVTRAAIHPIHGITASFNGTRKPIRETGIHLDGWLIQARFRGNGQATARGNMVRLLPKSIYAIAAYCVIRMTHIQTDAYTAWN